MEKKITCYEQLMNKSNACLELAKETKGYMSKVWLNHSRKLKEMALKLTWEEANMEVVNG